MPSHTMVPITITSALVAAEKYLHASRWWPKNDPQRKFLEQFYAERHNLHRFNERELRAWVDTVADNLNRILSDEGFNMKFVPFSPNEFGIISILDVAVEWLKPGRAVSRIGTKHFPCVVFDSDDTVMRDGTPIDCFSGYTVPHHPWPIARVPTRSGDIICMTIAGQEARGFELMARIDELRGAHCAYSHHSFLMFPVVDHVETKEVDWLLGLSTTNQEGERNRVTKATQQTKFKMNHLGAHLKDTEILDIVGTGAPRQPAPPLMIDQPFFLWITRSGLNTPILYAYLDESVWRDPGSLAM